MADELNEDVVGDEEVSPIKAAFAKHGYDVSDDMDEADILDRTIEKLKAQSDLERRAKAAEEEAARYKLELESKLQSQQQASPSPETQVKSAQDVAKRWARVEVDPDLLPFVEQDASGSYAPKAKFGAQGIQAAQELNQTLREKKRRAELLINDPLAAFEEAGLKNHFTSDIEKRFEEKFTKFQQELEAQRQKERDEFLAQKKEREGQDFFEQKKAELFKLSNNEPVIDPISQAAVMTPFGLQVKARTDYFLKQGLTSDMAVQMAYNIEKEIAEKIPTQNSKRDAFLGRDRQAPSQNKRASGNDVMQDASPKKFADWVLTDEDNAEALGSMYRGR